MLERIKNALSQQPGDPRYHRLAQVFADHVSPQRQRQPRLVKPPLTQVGNFVEALIAVIELSLMDQQACLDSPQGDCRQDLVERHHHDRHVPPQAKLQASE